MQFLSLENNKNVTSSLLEFHSSNPLKELRLRGTSFSSQIPSSIRSLDSLIVLQFSYCKFSGPLPSSLGRLLNLQHLSLYSNDLSGMVDFNMFLNMKNLIQLSLSYNKLSVLMKTAGNTNASIPKFESLSLSSCNLTSFPDFLRYQYKLKLLELSYNDIYGKIPRWIWNTSIDILEIDDNSLISFDIDAIPSDNLRIFCGSRNNLIGPLPALLPSIVHFHVPYNQLSCEISLLLFNLTFLESLDLSHNKLSGVLPNCLRNNIKHKVSSEKIPQMCFLGRQLRMMDLSHNQFQGRLPRSLAQFMQLEVLKLQNNPINDVFPSYLGTLPVTSGVRSS